MSDYYSSILNNESIENTVVSFYYGDAPYRVAIKYSEEERALATKKLIKILQSMTVDEIVDILEENIQMCADITANNIPIFSNINFVDDVLRIVKANPDCTCELIGYYFNKDAKVGAQNKYGGNHRKIAENTGLISSQRPRILTDLGEEFIKLDDNETDKLKPRLYLMIPIILKTIVAAKHGVVDVEEIMGMYLSEKSIERRRGNTRSMVERVCNEMAHGDKLKYNMIWKKNG